MRLSVPRPFFLGLDLRAPETEYFRLLRNERGLTLVEITVTVALLILLAGFAISLYLTGWKAWIEGNDVTTAHQRLGLSLERVSRELREAYELYSDEGVPLNEIAFESSLGETVVYTFDAENEQLMRSVYTTDGELDYQQVVAEQVTNVTFRIFSRDEDYPGGGGSGGGGEGNPGYPQNPGTPGEQGPPHGDDRPDPPGQVGNPGENDRPPPPGLGEEPGPPGQRKRRGQQDRVEEERKLVEVSITIRGGETDFGLASYVYVRNVY